MEKVKASYTNLKKGKSILRWIFAVIFILISFSAFEFSIIGGLLYILLGLFLVPQISDVLSNHDKLKFSQNNIVWYSIVLLLFIGGGQLVKIGEIESKKTDFLKNKTSILAEIEKDINNNSFNDASSKIKKHLDLLPQDEELKNLEVAIEDKKKEKTKKDLLNYIFSKKWGMSGIPCNLNGGSYQVFSSNFKIGTQLTFGGAPQKETDQLAKSSFEVLNEKTFRLVSEIYSNGNRIVENSVGPNKRVHYSLDEFTLLDNKTLQKNRIEHKQMNFDLMLKGVYREDKGSEWGKVSIIKICE